MPLHHVLSEFNLHRHLPMRESREQPIQRVLKLIDSCDQCSRALLRAAETSANPEFQEFAEKMTRQFDQFGFELRTELLRLGAADVPRISESTPVADCETLLKDTVAHYQDALNNTNSAHARAMLRRQHAEIRQALTEFLSHRAA